MRSGRPSGVISPLTYTSRSDALNGSGGPVPQDGPVDLRRQLREQARAHDEALRQVREENRSEWAAALERRERDDEARQERHAYDLRALQHLVEDLSLRLEVERTASAEHRDQLLYLATQGPSSAHKGGAAAVPVAERRAAWSWTALRLVYGLTVLLVRGWYWLLRPVAWAFVHGAVDMPARTGPAVRWARDGGDGVPPDVRVLASHDAALMGRRSAIRRYRRAVAREAAVDPPPAAAFVDRSAMTESVSRSRGAVGGDRSAGRHTTFHAAAPANPMDTQQPSAQSTETASPLTSPATMASPFRPVHGQAPNLLTLGPEEARVSWVGDRPLSSRRSPAPQSVPNSASSFKDTPPSPVPAPPVLPSRNAAGPASAPPVPDIPKSAARAIPPAPSLHPGGLPARHSHQGGQGLDPPSSGASSVVMAPTPLSSRSTPSLRSRPSPFKSAGGGPPSLLEQLQSGLYDPTGN